MTDIWSKWESQVVNGVFPLRRFLGRSNHSVVFLTEYAARNFSNAAIKLVPADPLLAEPQLSYWRRAAAFSHPHLICILDAGRCQLGGHPFLFVVMEYAEETLAQVLPRRPLTPEEAREMLIPSLDALAFLHSKGWVHGQLKPPNFLVVNDQVKLASDNAHPGGEHSASIAKRSRYDPPEAKSGTSSTAGDIWSLGVTIVEALTQRAPVRQDARSEAVSLPGALRPAFADAVRRCLSRNPEERPTIAELESQIMPAPQPPAQAPQTRAMPVSQAPAMPAPQAPAMQAPQAPAMPAPQAPVMPAPQAPVMPAPQAPAMPVPQAPVMPAPQAPAMPVPQAEMPVPQAPLMPVPPQVMRENSGPAVPAQRPPDRPLLVPAIAAGLVLLVVWGGSRLRQRHADSGQPESSVAQTSSPRAAPPPLPAQNPNPPMSAPSAVLHREIPEVPRRARASIRGHIKVTVRVTVDRAGNVVRETLQNPGSSRYFARLASAAAAKWKFAPAGDQASRVWLLYFEFARSGTTGQAAPKP